MINSWILLSEVDCVRNVNSTFDMIFYYVVISLPILVPKLNLWNSIVGDSDLQVLEEPTELVPN